MKQFIKRLVVPAAMSFAWFVPNLLYAQEWSAAQKDVWKMEETCSALYVAGDLEKFMAYFDDDYLGWYNRDPLPSTKAELRKWIEHDMKTNKVLVQSIKPVGIKIHGDIAFVDYYYVQTIKDAEGKEKTERGRWTDILMKQGDNWVLIGDHGGPEATEKE